MKKFMAVFTGHPDAFAKWQKQHADPKQREAAELAGMQGWCRWGEQNARSIVDNGAPLGKTKRVGPEGVTDIRNQIAGYAVVEAESHEVAAKMFLNHPHFTLFPGDGVEVMECLPIPEMPK